MIASKPMPPQEILVQLLEYDPETGRLSWKERGPEWFDDAKGRAACTALMWNKKFAGRAAFNTATDNGYRRGRLFREEYLAHRIIWKMVHGTEPDEIDHGDGDTGNNRLRNLSSVDRSGNLRNMALSCRNKSGVVGVSWAERDQHWVSSIHVKGEFVILGRFPDFDNAVKSRKEAERKYGFSERHGEPSLLQGRMVEGRAAA